MLNSRVSLSEIQYLGQVVISLGIGLKSQVFLLKCIYQATVSTQEKYPDGTNKTNNETYVGLTDTEFKLRYANHKQSFTNRTLQNATELSKYIYGN